MCCVLLASAAAQSETGFVDKVVELDGERHRYQVFVPEDYDAATRWPLLVFLNGRGECGRDGRRQASVGLGRAIRREPARWPFVVVFPQKPVKRTQWGDHEDLVLATLAQTERDYSIDASRRCLTGLSQGGSGAWELGSKHADTFGAVAPICGYRLGTWNVRGLAKTPVWAFHGEADAVVPVAQSRLLCRELTKAGGAPALTTYPGVGHNSWDRAYRDSALAEWFRLAPRQPLGARYLADHDGAAARVELRVGERRRAFEGDEAWRVVRQLVMVSAMDELRPDDGETDDEEQPDARFELRVQVDGEAGAWRRRAVFAADDAGSAAARAAIAAIIAADKR